MGTTNYRWLFRMVYEITIKKALGAFDFLGQLASYRVKLLAKCGFCDLTSQKTCQLHSGFKHSVFVWIRRVSNLRNRTSFLYSGSKEIAKQHLTICRGKRHVFLIFKERLSGGFWRHSPSKIDVFCDGKMSSFSSLLFMRRDRRHETQGPPWPLWWYCGGKTAKCFRG